MTSEFTFDYDRKDPDDLERIRKKAVPIISERIRKLGEELKVNIKVRQLPESYAPALEVTDLVADTPGQGAGTKLMQELIRLAEDVHLDIHLMPAGPRTRQFFERLGFEKDRRRFAMWVKYSSPPEYLAEKIQQRNKPLAP